MFLFMFFGLVFGGVYSSFCGYPFFFSVLLYMFFLLLNISMLDEFSDSLRQMDTSSRIGICLMTESKCVVFFFERFKCFFFLNLVLPPGSFLFFDSFLWQF